MHLPFLQRLRGVGLALAPFAMVTAFFTALYMMIPNTRVTWRAALTGAVGGRASCGRPPARCSPAFVVYSTRLTLVYAGFAFVVAALLWTYFGWLVLLAGAQLSFYVQNPSYLRLGLQVLRLSSVELEELALKLMYLVGRTHVAGGRRWTVNRLAGELGLPAVAVAQMTSALEKAAAAGGHRHRRAAALARHRQHRASTRSSRSRAPRAAATSRHVTCRSRPSTACSRSIEDMRRHRCGELTLRDLVDEAPRPQLSVARGAG